MNIFVLTAAWTTAAILAMTALLHLVPRLGAAGRRVSDALCRAPLLDVLITYFTVGPLIVGPIVGGWAGLAGGVLGQIVSVNVWTLLHGLACRKSRGGPRIHKELNKIVGPWRNYTAVWLTAFAVPLFWVVRMVELFLYPPIRMLVRFPKYDQGDWVNVSRHKFEGLVSHDLIWCLYCDWMTGIWSLGSEMLRNVESFWCPIKFASNKKCANCQVDFPDIEGGWVPANASMADATRVIAAKYDNKPGGNSWYGHPARITVDGKPLEEREKELAGV